MPTLLPMRNVGRATAGLAFLDEFVRTLAWRRHWRDQQRCCPSGSNSAAGPALDQWDEAHGEGAVAAVTPSCAG